MAAHTYWRFRIRRNGGGGNTNCAEIALRNAAATDITANATFSVSSSFSASYNETKLADGNLSTMWVSSGGGDDSWVQAKFASAVEIGAFDWTIRNDGYVTEAPLIIVVQSSDDGVTWTDEFFGLVNTEVAAWAVGGKKTFARPADATDATHWGLYVAANNGDLGYVAAAEMQYRTTAGTAEVPSGGTAEGINYSSATYPFGKAYDGDLATWWADDTDAQRSWIGYAFTAARSVAEIALSCNDSGTVAPQMPADFWIIRSNDGVGWAPVRYISGATNWAAGETRLFSAIPDDVVQSQLEYSPAGANTWTAVTDAVLTDLGVEWDTSALADGSYDLRVGYWSNSKPTRRYSDIVTVNTSQAPIILTPTEGENITKSPYKITWS